MWELLREMFAFSYTSGNGSRRHLRDDAVASLAVNGPVFALLILIFAEVGFAFLVMFAEAMGGTAGIGAGLRLLVRVLAVVALGHALILVWRCAHLASERPQRLQQPTEADAVRALAAILIVGAVAFALLMLGNRIALPALYRLAGLGGPLA
jgi:Na+-driven multidrug efflux pump